MKISINDDVMIDGQVRRFRDWCELYGININVARRRVEVQGRSMFDAITSPVLNMSQRGRNNSQNSPWRKYER